MKVTLNRQTTTGKNGRRYAYWVLRWRDAGGKRRSQLVGPTTKLSKRQADKARRAKETELALNPGRLTAGKTPTLGEYVDAYLRARRSELAPGTLAIHETTSRYLLAHFGEGRRLDAIGRADARGFKTALAGNELARVQQHGKKRDLSAATVHMHLRNARTIFEQATRDDLIPFNPFHRLAGAAPPPKEWHYIGMDEFATLVEWAPRRFRELLALTRLAGLRRGEALHLRWGDIDWERGRLTVIASGDWRPKDREPRTVPVCALLADVLSAAFSRADDGAEYVITPGTVNVSSVSRDFTALCRRAGVKRYGKPLHTLRKSCLTDWARAFPMHVVSAWAGHASITTTQEFYLQVGERDYAVGAAFNFASGDVRGMFSHNFYQNSDIPGHDAGTSRNVSPERNECSGQAGERIRTADVQLGKLAFYH